jgi:hypothetical protein
MNFDVPNVLLSLTIKGKPAMLAAVQFVPAQGENPPGETDVYTPGGMFTVDQSPEEVAKAWLEAEAEMEVPNQGPAFNGQVFEQISKSLGFDVVGSIRGSGMLPEDLNEMILAVFPNNDVSEIDAFTKAVFTKATSADRESLQEFMKRRTKHDEPEDRDEN